MKKHSVKLPQHLPYAKIQNFSKSSLLFYIKCLHKIISSERVVLSAFRKRNRKLVAKLKTLQPVSKPREPTPEKEEVEDPLKFIQEIKSVAEEAQRVAGFVYEPVSGLYYDNKTGYYYNADLRLYYDGNTGIYYSYDAATNQFLYHSQVYTDGKETDVVSLMAEVSGEKKESQSGRRRQRKRKKSPEKPKEEEEMEDGEVLSSEESEEEAKLSSEAVHYAPSLRIIVQESAVDHLSAGTLFVITCKGGTLGREGLHDILIRDVNVSKHHLKFTYDDTKSTYQVIDLGSTNGTILNGQRMTTSKRESEPLDLLHDSVIELSGTRLLCHIHGGSETCDDCHPGVLKAPQKTPSAAESHSLEQSRLQIQKRLQKKYGLATEKYQEPKNFSDETYVDRAANRRVTVGSSHDGEKTEVASTEWAISRKNKGFKLLSQMGWSEGQGLGTAEEALKEPIAVVGNQGTAGLGYGS